jgi:parallel beta-helix repeat protein
MMGYGQWVLLLLALLPISLSAATTRYAFPGGLGSPPCTSNPNNTSACSLQTAVPILQQGDTLYLRQGTYNSAIGPISMPVPSGGCSGSEPADGSWPNPITIASYPNETATITGGLQIQQNFDGSYPNCLIFDRLLLNMGGAELSALRTGDFVHHVRLQNSELTNANQNLFQGTHSSHHIHILNNNIHGAMYDFSFVASEGKTTGAYGMYINLSDSIIENNRIYDNFGYAIHHFRSGFSSGAERNIIRGNAIANNCFNDGTRNQGLNAVILASSTDVKFYNNVVYNNICIGTGAAITVYAVSNAIVYQNTVHGNNGSGIEVQSNASNTQAKNNIVYGNAGGGTQIANAGSGTGYAANLCNATSAACAFQGNPGFANPAGGDFHILLAGSPANNIGTMLGGVYATDAENLARPPGQISAGAYQFAGSPPAGPFGNIAKYTWEQGSGTVVTDASGTNHPCTMNSAVYGPGLVGSFSFAPTGTQYCSAAGVTALKPVTQFGLAAWISSTATDTGGGTLVALPNDGAILYLLPDGRSRCQLYDGASFPSVTSTAAYFGGVHHVSCSYLKGDGLRLRVDNVQVPGGFLSLNVNVAYTLGGGTGNLEVGRSSGSPTGYTFRGYIDQVYVYDQEITATGNTNLYNEVPVVPGLAQMHQAWYQAGVPQGSQIGTTDTDKADWPLATPIGIRYVVTKTDPGSLTEYLRPFCRVNTGSGFPDWTSALEVTNSFGSLGIRYYADPAITQGEATGLLLPLDGFTGAAGKVLINPIDTSSPYLANQRITIAQNQHIEQEIRVEFGSPLVAGNQVQCLLTRETGMALNGYLNIQTLTFAVPATTLSLSGGTYQGITVR